MAKKISEVWAWLSKSKNQKTLAFVGGGIAVAVAAGWQAYIHFSSREVSAPTPPQVTATQRGIATEGDVTATTQPGGTAVIAADDVTIGITLQEHEASLRHREHDIRAQLAKVHREEQAVLEKQLEDLHQQLANLNESYQKRVEFLQAHIVALERLKGQFPDEALEAAKAALARGDTSKADTLFQAIEEKAEATYHRGQIAEAAIDYRAAYAKYLRASQLQPDNADYQKAAGNMAHSLALYDQAIEFHETALWLYRTEKGEESPEVAGQWTNLGLAWADEGDYDRAIDYYEKALKVDIATFGEDHPDVARDWNNLGTAWADKGEYDTAIGYYEKALKVDLATFGENHPKVAIRWNNLGAAWADKGEYDKAIGYYEKALKVFQQRLGKDHPNTAVMRKNLGRARAARASQMRDVQ